MAILYHFIHSWYIFDHQGLNIIVKTQKILNWSLEIDIETQSIQISLRRLCKLMGAATNRERLIVARVQYFLLRVVPKWTQNIFFWLKSEKITSFRLWEVHEVQNIHITTLGYLIHVGVRLSIFCQFSKTTLLFHTLCFSSLRDRHRDPKYSDNPMKICAKALYVLDQNQMITFLWSIDCFDFSKDDFRIKSVRARQRKLNEMKNVLVEHVKANCTCTL